MTKGIRRDFWPPAIERAIAMYGSQTALARAAGVSQSIIARAIDGKCTPRVAVAIERATKGEVSRRELCQDPSIFAEPAE